MAYNLPSTPTDSENSSTTLAPVRVPTVQPVLSIGMLVILVVVFVLGIILDQLAGLDATRAFTRGSEVLFSWGGKVNELVLAGEWWRLITPAFLHLGIIHLAFNGYFLYVMGTQVESIFGHVRFALVYGFAAVWGNLFSLALTPNPSAGASGALFGVLGAMATFLYLNRKSYGAAGNAYLRNVLFIIGINLVFGLSSGIDNWAHVGGLVCGGLLAAMLGPRLSLKVSPEAGPYVSDDNPLADNWWWVAMFAALTVFMVILALQVAPATPLR